MNKKPGNQITEYINKMEARPEANLKNLAVGALCGADLVARLPETRHERHAVVDERREHLVDLQLHLWRESRRRRVARHLEVRLARHTTRIRTRNLLCIRNTI